MKKSLIIICRTTIKCYFDKLQVNGTLKIDYSPVKGDKVKIVN